MQKDELKKGKLKSPKNALDNVNIHIIYAVVDAFKLLIYLEKKKINYPRGWPGLGVITLPSVRKMGRLSVILQYDSRVFYRQATRCKDQTLMIKQYKRTTGATRLYIKCLGPRIYAANKLTNMLQTVMPEKIL